MKKILEIFLEFEKKNHLFNEEVRGVKYWHFIRFEIFYQVLSQRENLNQPHTIMPFNLKRFWLVFKQIKNFFTRNSFLFLSEKDVLVLNHPRRVKNGEYYDCIYTDNILEKINYSYYVLEKPYLEEHFTPIRTKNLRYLDFIRVIAESYSVIKRKGMHSSLSESERQRIKTIIEILNQEMDSDINPNKIINLVEKLIFFDKVYSWYFNYILNRINPKVIIEVIHYSWENLILNKIAKQKGIPVIELQHGTMGKYHIAYNFKNKPDLISFPDYIFMFGQFWKDTTRLPINQWRAKVVGWPFYEQKLSLREKKIKNNYQTILFISQGQIGKELSKVALELSKLIDLKKYKIIYKLHPGEYKRWEKEYFYLKNNDIEVIDNNDHDIHYYLSQADVQVGVASTAVFEGLGYGLKTIVYKSSGHEYLEELYSNNIAFLASNVKELLNHIYYSETPQYDIDSFWQSHSIEKIKANIKEIIEDHERVKK